MMNISFFSLPASLRDLLISRGLPGKRLNQVATEIPREFQGFGASPGNSVRKLSVPDFIVRFKFLSALIYS
jgi:hypothetical protein